MMSHLNGYWRSPPSQGYHTSMPYETPRPLLGNNICTCHGSGYWVSDIKQSNSCVNFQDPTRTCQESFRTPPKIRLWGLAACSVERFPYCSCRRQDGSGIAMQAMCTCVQSNPSDSYVNYMVNQPPAYAVTPQAIVPPYAPTKKPIYDDANDIKNMSTNSRYSDVLLWEKKHVDQLKQQRLEVSSV